MRRSSITWYVGAMSSCAEGGEPETTKKAELRQLHEPESLSSCPAPLPSTASYLVQTELVRQFDGRRSAPLLSGSGAMSTDLFVFEAANDAGFTRRELIEAVVEVERASRPQTDLVRRASMCITCSSRGSAIRPTSTAGPCSGACEGRHELRSRQTPQRPLYIRSP